MRQPRLTTIAAALLLHWGVGAASATALLETTTEETTTHTAATAATTTSSTLTIYVPSNAPTTGAAAATGAARNYVYQGCYLDIAGTNGTAPGARSLQGDTTDEVLPGDMTVPKCLEYCGGGGSGMAYNYAGLEYSRECWCGQELSSLATKEGENQCNLPCDGNNGTACGGKLRLTLYKLKSPASRAEIAFGAMAIAGLAAVAQLL